MLANVIGGLGRASAKDPESFALLYRTSPRFRRAIEMVEYAASLSDPDALAAYVSLLDPAFWLHRAAEASRHDDREARDDFRAIARHVEASGRRDRLMKVQRVLHGDFLLLADELKLVRPEAGARSGIDAESREALAVLHALRVALIQRVWRLAMHVPEFSPQLGTSVEDLIQRLLQLDVESVVAQLGEIFPLAKANEPGSENFGETATYLADSQRTYRGEHREIFDPMARIFGLIRRIGAAVTYHAGAVG
jgi:phosphoenolpyruvate carboxylase